MGMVSGDLLTIQTNGSSTPMEIGESSKAIVKEIPKPKPPPTNLDEAVLRELERFSTHNGFTSSIQQKLPEDNPSLLILKLEHPDANSTSELVLNFFRDPSKGESNPMGDPMVPDETVKAAVTSISVQSTILTPKGQRHFHEFLSLGAEDRGQAEELVNTVVLAPMKERLVGRKSASK